MMYKTLAEKTGEGGIWNNSVHIVKVKEDYSPQLAMKIILKHNSRDQIKVVAGVSVDPEDELPTGTLGFPIFDFQGGSQYMQGGTSDPENKTIEFGLDISPLLGEITSGQSSKFFLQIIENDPEDTGTGEIIGFSLMDYINGLNEIPYPQSNVPIVNNGTTTLGIEANINFDQLHITNGLPAAVMGEPYEHQFTASGGTHPYHWDMVRHYERISSTGEFPTINEIKLQPSDTTRGMALKLIDFPFPFYGDSYDSIFVHTEGFIMFDDNDYPWPYLYDENLMIKKTRIVAPFLNAKIVLDTLSGDGLWYEGNENHAAFRWRVTSLTPEIQDINFVLKLYPSGAIEFYYENNDMFIDSYWSAGISNGDDVNYQYASDVIVSTNKKIVHFTPGEFPSEMSLSEDGIFSGTPVNKYTGLNVEFMLTDYNNIAVRKTIPFYCWYAGVEGNNLENELNVFPNPATDFINIEFQQQEKANISINIYNLEGKLVANIIKGTFEKGQHNISWNGCNDQGVKLQKGIYFCKMEFALHSITKKLLLHHN